MFLHNWWYVAAWSHQVPSGEFAAERILNEPIVLYRKGMGQSLRWKIAAAIASRPSRAVGSRVMICAVCTTASSSRHLVSALRFPVRTGFQPGSQFAPIPSSSRIGGFGCGWETLRGLTRR
jgi:hypothetical protein